MVITHTLTHVHLASGFPTVIYTEKLGELDRALIELFEKSREGLSVLVETCNGKRIYYKYILGNIDIEEARADLKKRFPEEKLTWEIEKNQSWTLIKRYAIEYNFKDAVMRGPAFKQ